VGKNGWWVRLRTGVILVGALGIGTAACGSSGPSAAAKALCGSVLGAPPPADSAVAYSEMTVKEGEDSGNTALDQAASNWIRGLDDHDNAAVSLAERQVVTTCEQLRIPLGTFTAP
jgi:hypothetical protein